MKRRSDYISEFDGQPGDMERARQARQAEKRVEAQEADETVEDVLDFFRPYMDAAVDACVEDLTEATCDTGKDRRSRYNPPVDPIALLEAPAFGERVVDRHSRVSEMFRRTSGGGGGASATPAPAAPLHPSTTVRHDVTTLVASHAFGEPCFLCDATPCVCGRAS